MGKNLSFFQKIYRKIVLFLKHRRRKNRKYKAVYAYIDWFNVFHALKKSLGKKYYWLDYRSLCEKYIDKSKWEKLEMISYFTAYYNQDKEWVKRHKTYIAALNKRNVRSILGKYQSVVRKFSVKHNKIGAITINKWNINKRLHNQETHDSLPRNEDVISFLWTVTYRTFEEKRTDVNMAIQILSDWLLDKYSKAIIITGDSDISPAIKQVNKIKGDKEFLTILPIGSKWKVMEKMADNYRTMSIDDIKNSQLLDNVGWIKKPESWC